MPEKRRTRPPPTTRSLRACGSCGPEAWERSSRARLWSSFPRTRDPAALGRRRRVSASYSNQAGDDDFQNPLLSPFGVIPEKLVLLLLGERRGQEFHVDGVGHRRVEPGEPLEAQILLRIELVAHMARERLGHGH